MTNGSFNGVTFHYALPSSAKPHGAMSEEIRVARRLQIAERPGVDGAAIRDFGEKARVFSLRVIFLGDTWSADFEAFKAALKSGSPQKLILPTEPEAVNAVFSERTEIVQVGDGNAKITTVTWIEDNSDVQTVIHETIATSKSLLMGRVQTVGSLLSNNKFLAAVQTVNAELSTTRSVVNAVTTLSNSVQNQIKQLTANINGTLALVEQGIQSIDSAFGTKAAATASLTPGPIVDPVTGHPYQSVSRSQSAASSASLLTQPALASQVSIPIQNTDTKIGATALIKTFVATLESQHDSLVSLCGTQTTDVQAGIISLVNALNQYASFVQPAPTQTFTTTRPMSLAEALFQVNGSLDTFEQVYQQNPWIDDVLVLPIGSEVII